MSHYYHRQFLPSILPSILSDVIFGTLSSGFRGKPVVYVRLFSCTLLYSGEFSLHVINVSQPLHGSLCVSQGKTIFFEDALSLLFFDKVISFIGDCCAAVVYPFPCVHLIVEVGNALFVVEL